MNTSILSRLSSGGHELDTSPRCFGELRSSFDLVGDGVALRERMEEDGYLYLPGYFDREEVRDARRIILERLADQGHLDPAFEVMDGVANAQTDISFKPDLAFSNPPLMKLLYTGRMMAFYQTFLGGEVRHFDFTWLRAVSPGQGTLPHCDIVFMGRGTTNLFTAWTPLGDIPYAVGGLIVLESSHRHQKLRQNYGRRDVDTFCQNKPRINKSQGHISPNPVSLRQALGGRWLSSEFRMGDLLTFSMFTVHASLDNQSNQIRLSSDSRYQLASEPADERWIGDNPIGHGPTAKRGLIC